MTEGYKQKEYGQAVKRYCQTLDLNTQRNRPLCVIAAFEHPAVSTQQGSTNPEVRIRRIGIATSFQCLGY